MKKIVYADDNAVISGLYKAFHKRSYPDYEFALDSDGNSLKRRLEGITEDIALVVTDNEMPGMHGREIIREFASNPEYSHIKFILVYGDTDESIGQEAVHNGAYAFLMKPFSIDTFIPLVDKALGIERK